MELILKEQFFLSWQDVELNVKCIIQVMWRNWHTYFQAIFSFIVFQFFPSSIFGCHGEDGPCSKGLTSSPLSHLLKCNTNDELDKTMAIMAQYTSSKNFTILPIHWILSEIYWCRINVICRAKWLHCPDIIQTKSCISMLMSQNNLIKA